MSTTRYVTAFASVLLTSVAIVRAGDVTPPSGPVSSTMKTLQQVEPRTPISQSDIPMVIAAPGSYYLTGNIEAVNASPAITISASDVTLDLSGFRMNGNPNEVTAGDFGVLINEVTNVSVGNGAIVGWRFGGVSAPLATNSQFHDLRLEGNGWDPQTPGPGIRTGANCVLERITAKSNGEYGIRSHGSVVRACAASFNGADGILATSGTITDCVGNNNVLAGINTGTGGLISNCVAAFNGEDGFDVGFTGVIMNSSADNNGRYGIRAVSQATIINNRSHFNDGAGIHIVGSDARIDGNNCLGNSIGIDVDGNGNIVVRNTVGNSTNTDYTIAGGNSVGTIQMSPVGAGAWDNFRY